MSGKHAAVNPATLGHHHEAVQFRDGKEPHCRTCGLTADGRTPQRRPFGNTDRVNRGPEPAAGEQSRPPSGGAGGSQPGPIAPTELPVSPSVIARALRDLRTVRGRKS